MASICQVSAKSMKLPAFIYQNRFGTYYLRVLVSKQLREKFDDTRKEIRVSLGTGKRREALAIGCGLYSEFQNLFSEMAAMAKLIWNGKEVDAVEWYERNTQRLKAEHAIKKSRNKQRIQGYYGESLEANLTDEEKAARSTDHVSGSMAIVRKGGKYRIADVISKFVERKRSENAWTKKTEESRIAILNIFAEIMGDRYFDEIGFDDMDYYRDCISRLPINLKWDKRLKGKSILEAIAVEGVERISIETRNKHIANIGYLFNWAVGRYTDRNYTTGLITREGKKKKVREIFTTEELQKIVSGDEYMRVQGKKHKGHANFWVPLIGMFTGARLNEICQLKVDDIREENGIWYFAFCSEGEATAKTESAIRNTPIHEMLIKLGFLNYVKRQRRHKAERLFSELSKHSKNGFGAQVGKWFNATYLVRCGVKDQAKDGNKKVFHSFRHTVVNHLQRRNVDKDRIRVIVGHGIDDYSYYQHDQGLKLLAEEVAKIDYEIDFSHLFNAHNNEYLKM